MAGITKPPLSGAACPFSSIAIRSLQAEKKSLTELHVQGR